MEQLKKFADATGNDIFDPEFDGGSWMIKSVETRETIEDFIRAAKGYASATKEKFGEIAGFKFIAFSEVQLRKGDRRRQLSVVDFGDVRYALDCDLTDYT